MLQKLLNLHKNMTSLGIQLSKCSERDLFSITMVAANDILLFLILPNRLDHHQLKLQPKKLSIIFSKRLDSKSFLQKLNIDFSEIQPGSSRSVIPGWSVTMFPVSHYYRIPTVKLKIPEKAFLKSELLLQSSYSFWPIYQWQRLGLRRDIIWMVH